MNTSKIVGFCQGAFYPVVWAIITAVLNYVIAFLPASGILSPSIALIVCGVLSQIENSIQSKGGGALFGFAG